ncbi:hypothetical protein F3Y22_tig00007895pilonHSYRG00140 [Hibiscus syriacus]|uniref:Uncharacterized protein n=1 Tax=Hibiscus syriacus TaxID=106335 RepID=A0A6A3CBG0_HIBSY|nr:hypothetical protein F3Y22_tig00007895pilonHSYRG00140 [Hibiscus syriacus]
MFRRVSSWDGELPWATHCLKGKSLIVRVLKLARADKADNPDRVAAHGISISSGNQKRLVLIKDILDNIIAIRQLKNCGHVVSAGDVESGIATSRFIQLLDEKWELYQLSTTISLHATDCEVLVHS